MSNLEIDSQGANLTLSNLSSTRSQDALVFDLIVNGQRRLFWIPIVLRPGSAAALHVHFLTTVEAPIIILCGDHPGGVVDDPDPITGVIFVDP